MMDGSALLPDPRGEAGHGEDISVAQAWLDLGLVESLRLPEGKPAEELALRLEAARAMVAELAPVGAGERALAVHFTAAQAAALGWQGEANRHDLPPAARATAQRLACQLMSLSTRLIQTLDRLQARRETRVEGAEAKRAAAGANPAERRGEAPATPCAPIGQAWTAPDAIPFPSPPDANPPLNRQQRRAAKRQGRKLAAMGQGP